MQIIQIILRKAVSVTAGIAFLSGIWGAGVAIANPGFAERERDGASPYGIIGSDAVSSPVPEQPLYVMDVADEIEVAVWRVEDASRTVTIRPDGRISLPLVGELPAAGLTPEQLTELITARLKEHFILDPQVTVIVNKVASKKVLVLGEVKNPGVYTLSERLSALSAVAKAGGQNRHAHLETTLIISNVRASQPDVRVVDLQSILKEGNIRNDVLLQPGDVVYVPKSFMGKVEDIMSFVSVSIQPWVNDYFLYRNIQILEDFN